MSRYREDMRRAWNRINAVPAGRLETGFGTVEYTQKGPGVPLRVSHGVLGCHADGVDGWWAGLPGPGFRLIAPSRHRQDGMTTNAPPDSRTWTT